jgi:hypothetical protein
MATDCDHSGLMVTTDDDSDEEKCPICDDVDLETVDGDGR